jgi:hypothetical protein
MPTLDNRNPVAESTENHFPRTPSEEVVMIARSRSFQDYTNDGCCSAACLTVYVHNTHIRIMPVVFLYADACPGCIENPFPEEESQIDIAMDPWPCA